MFDIIVVGAGTAGLSAAIYAVRAGKSVLLLEQKNYGGQIINTPQVENYPGIKQISGYDFATNLYEQAIALGAEIEYEKVIKIEQKQGEKQVVTKDKSYTCKSVILATGSKNRQLGLEREEQLTGAGISYCATCDGIFFRGREVAVVGGGNTAVEDAMFLSNYCSKVYVIHRREGFRGEEKQLEALREKENVEFVLNAVVTDITGEEVLERICVEDKKTGEKRELEVSGLFVAIGQEPENSYFADIIQLDQQGYIVADESCQTNREGIFTAGDCRTKKVRQLATAASDGAVAALAACEYIG